MQRRRTTRTRLFRPIPLIATLLAILLPGQQIFAFWPTNIRVILVPGISFFDETHESITKNAMKDLDNEFFSITSLTSSMKDAISEVADNNAKVDKDQTNGFLHFDGESFINGQTRLVQSKTAIINLLKNSSDGSAARAALGGALHTLQDFYSHSDWVELGHSDPNTAITNGGLISFSPPTERTCAIILGIATGTIVSSNLTSGYYHGENEVKPSPDPGKCNHGGLADLLKGGINKDVSNLDWSPHGLFHSTAASVAKEATKQYIRDIKNTPGVTIAQMKKLFGVELTLAIAIDTTGSMGSIIDSVKTQAIAMVDQRIGTPLEPTKYVLAPFNDPFVPPAQAFDDPSAFKSAISGLFASGGGDCPELAVTGMLQGLATSGEGGDLFMFTDASAKDSASVGEAITLARDKKITVHEPLFGSCSPVDPAFIQLASATGGEYFFLSRSEAGNIASLSDILVRPNKVNIVAIDDTLSGASKDYTVPVDPSLQRVNFVVSGTNSVVVKRPNGNPVSTSDSDVKSIPLSTGNVVSVDSPATGSWTITITSTGTVSLRVTGQSTSDLEAFRFNEAAGRPGHEGFFPIAGQPILGQTYLASGTLTPGLTADSFTFRSPQGAVGQLLSLTEGTGTLEDTYTGSVTLPTSPFFVYATGTDSSGQPFQRMRSFSFQPQPIQVTPPLTEGFTAGQASTLVFNVKNFGSADTFRFIATDNKGYLGSVTPGTFTLNPNEAKDVSLQIMPPSNANAGDSSVLTVSVESIGSPGISNGTTLLLLVTDGFVVDREPPKLQVAASPAVLWPPDHKMKQITVTTQVSDNLDPSPTVKLESITSNENQDALGDGHTSPDITVDSSGKISLRAERSAVDTDRIYTITYSARDRSGNVSFASAQVVVPHDQKK